LVLLVTPIVAQQSETVEPEKKSALELLRGRELRDAIHAEHAKRGKGHMNREMKREMKGGTRGTGQGGQERKNQ
jgi:hypothetical protein